MHFCRLTAGLLCLHLLGLLAGCSQSGPAPESQDISSSILQEDSSPARQTPPEENHGHKPGAHGGFIVSVGADSYHAEVVVEKGGGLRLLTLGRDESRIQEVESQVLTAFIKAKGNTDAVQVRLTAQPQDGDSEGTTSQFAGVLPQEFVGEELDITIPNLRIGGERFRLGFSVDQGLDHDSGMPAGVAASAEEALYLTPGGAYTEADIAANGKVTASVKFRGIKSEHDMHPKSGDKLCPITLTKGNPKFIWIVGGKPYEFCCPPCVDEFVRLAKEQPQALKPPESFIK